MKDRIRSVFVWDCFGPYHNARLVASALACDSAAVEVRERSSEYGWVPQAPNEKYLRITVQRGSGLNFSPRTWEGEIRRALERANPQVLFIPGWSGKAAFVALCWAAENGLPVVVMSESSERDESRSWWKEWVKARILRSCSCAFVGGRLHADYLRRLGMPRDRIFFGYDAVDNDYFAREAGRVRSQEAAFRTRYSLPGGFFLASARFVEKKNLRRLVQAYAIYREKAESSSYRQKGKPWNLVLLGDGPLRATLEAEISTLHLSAHIQLPGFKQYPELPVYYGLAKAFIHCSTTEQWGLVVNEAMASGLPVVVSNRCGCAAELVREGVNGFTFDPRDVEELAALMVRIFAANSELSAMGRQSQRIIADWGPKRFAAGFEASMRKAIEVGPKRAGPLDRLLLSALMRTRAA